MNVRRLISAMVLCSVAAPTVSLAGITLPSGFSSVFQATTTGTTSSTGGTTGTTVETLDAATIEACKETPALCGITLVDVAGDVLFGETEPNNYRFSADPITPDIPLTGQLYSEFDSDWFFLQTTEVNDIVTVSMADSDGAWNISIRDSSGNILSSADTLSGEAFSLDATIANTGNLYIVVSPSASGYTDKMFKLAVHLQNSELTDVQDPYNFFDVELERNNLFSTANPLVSGISMQGQFMDGGDLDVYRLDSPGNEIISLELCGENDSCAGQGSWVLAMVDAEAVTDSMLTTYVSGSIYDDSANGGIPGYVSRQFRHPYYLLEAGVFSDALIGLIDPTWGVSTTLNVGVRNPGTYYVMVMPPLKRDSNGSIEFVSEAIDDVNDPFGYVVFPFSDDQYTVRVRRTDLMPSMEPLQ